MTALAHDPYVNVTEACDEDLQASIRMAEHRSGFTYDQLAEQARTGTISPSRRAWHGS